MLLLRHRLGLLGQVAVGVGRNGVGLLGDAIDRLRQLLA
jgi:hypothetical protein